MKKRIYVACGGAVATSTVVANKVRDFLKKEGIDADVQQCRISELGNHASNADLFITTAKVTKSYDVPVVHGLSFITGINQDKAEKEILEKLK